MADLYKDRNWVDLSQYRGPITRCNQCNIENRMSGRSCLRCLDKGFTAQCLACKGTGLRTMGSVWDGGRSQHTSPCDMCGGKGCFPVPKPKDWVDEITVDTQSTQPVDDTKLTV
jgi:hypothetical protein